MVLAAVQAESAEHHLHAGSTVHAPQLSIEAQYWSVVKPLILTGKLLATGAVDPCLRPRSSVCRSTMFVAEFHVPICRNTHRHTAHTRSLNKARARVHSSEEASSRLPAATVES